MLHKHLAGAHPNCFALAVSGSCTDKVFTDADHVFVDPDIQPRDGSIAVMLIGGKSEMRRVRMGRSSMVLVAESHGDYPDMIVAAGDGQETTCQGVVFWWQARKETE